MLETFRQLKKELEKATLHSIDKSLPLKVECDTSDVASSAILNQRCHVAFISRTLQEMELKHHSGEKEMMATIEAVHKCNHYFTWQHFTLITNHRSVAKEVHEK